MTRTAPSPPDEATPGNKNGERTRLLILDAAETLFSEHGLDGVSMRDISDAAGVTLALVHYHFKSKDGLYRAAIERRSLPVATLRREALRQVLERRPGPPDIREVLDALARPWVEMRQLPGGLAYTRLVARETGDPAEGRRGIVADLLDPIAVEFIAAMKTALPGMTPRRVTWGYHFFIGALLLILSNPDRVKRLSGDLCDITDDQAVVDEIVDFFTGALRAERPAAKKAPSKSTPRSTSKSASTSTPAPKPATPRRKTP